MAQKWKRREMNLRNGPAQFRQNVFRKHTRFLQKIARAE
jgi:hypothetical protein